MSLTKFRELLVEHFKVETASAEGMIILEFLDKQIVEQKAEYKLNKDTGRISFGKYKGFTIKDVLKCPSGKGESYLQWLMNQSWFVDEKYPDLYQQIKDCKIKKKVKTT